MKYGNTEYEQYKELILPEINVDANGDDIAFENNPNRKRAGVQLAYTIEHIEEIERCRTDIFYFAEKYYHILDLDKGMLKIKLREYQKEMLRSFVENRNTIVNATRQCVRGDSKIRLRNKRTNDIVEINIEDFFEMLAIKTAERLKNK